MKRRCIDPMTDEWQEWDEPRTGPEILGIFVTCASWFVFGWLAAAYWTAWS